MRASAAPLLRGLVLIALACLLELPAARAADDYVLGPDSAPRTDVPHGVVHKSSFKSTRIYPGTERDYWVYVPAQYDGGSDAALMVFQDGGTYVNAEGPYRAPVVFDNLIAKKEMPVTIAVFVSPGTVPGAVAGQKPRNNRSYEYDSLGDRYARFLLEELLPVVERKWRVTQNPDLRAISGGSSGGICAFTAAWERPDSFRKVHSDIGSFVNIRGGDVYPGLIRKTEKKPLRVFLQDGTGDLDNLHGNWPLGNRQMAAALKFMGYDHKLVLGDGAHTRKHGGSIFPEAMRWLWRTTP